MGTRRINISSDLLAMFIRGEIKGPCISNAPPDLRVDRLLSKADGGFALICSSTMFKGDNPKELFIVTHEFPGPAMG